MDILYNKINDNTTIFFEFQKVLDREYYYISKYKRYDLDGKNPNKIVFENDEDCEKFIRILEDQVFYITSPFKKDEYNIGIGQFKGEEDFFVIKYIYETSDELPQIFYSQPMTGLSLEEIVSTRLDAQKEIEKILGYSVSIIDNLQLDENYDDPLKYLGNDISIMSKANMVIFNKNWSKSRGCKVEEYIARLYDKKIKYL